MKSLAYFASGYYKGYYQKLPFDNIFLIDNCFRGEIIDRGKVCCIGMDCLESIEYLKRLNVKIDFFVSLNEGLYEGGGHYAINSEMFLGYAMPLFNDVYYHLMNKAYYFSHPDIRYNVTMNLPYRMTEIMENEQGYLSYDNFSDAPYHKGNAKVYRMEKKREEFNIHINNSLKITVIHDSIWTDYNQLDLTVISLNPQGQDGYFDKLPKVANIKGKSFDEILEFCVYNKVSTIGFMPWLKGKYDDVIKSLKTYNKAFPKEIRFYHLNKGDYQIIKKLHRI